MGRAFVIRHRCRVSAQPPQTVAVAIGQVERDLDPFPTFGRNGFGFSLKLLADQTIEQGGVFQPAAVIALEEVVQHGAASSLVRPHADKGGPTVRRAHRRFGQHAPDLIGLFVPGRPDRLPDLNLTLVIWIDRESHQLLQRHFILGIKFEQGRDHGGEFQALFDHLRRDEESGRDLFIALTLLPQRHEGAELIERMQGSALHVLSERVVFGEDSGIGIPNDAGNGRGLGQAFLLHQERQCLEASAASGDFELAGLGPIIRQNGPDAQALQQPAAGDVFGKFLDRDPGLDAPDVGLAQHELVEGNVLGRGQGDFLGRFRHQIFSTTGAGSHSSDLTSRHPFHNPLSPSTVVVRGQFLGGSSRALSG